MATTQEQNPLSQPQANALGAPAPAPTPSTPPGGGLIANAMSAPPPVSADQVKAPAPAQANTWNIDKNQTVSGQLDSVLAKDSPLLQQARTRASQAANQRGLLNSSMAISAGESAAYDAALPIAQQDAQTYATSGQFNAGEKNKLLQQQLDQQMQAGLANQSANLEAQKSNQAVATTLTQQQLDQQFKENQASLDRALQTSMQTADNQTKIQLQKMDADTRAYLAEVEANYKTLMQTSQGANDLYQQTLKNMTDIMMSKDLDAGGKQQALNNQYALLRDGMGIIGAVGNMNLKDLLNPGNIPGAGGASVSTPAPAPAPPAPAPAPRYDNRGNELTPWGYPDRSNLP